MNHEEPLPDWIGDVRLITFDCYGTLIDWEKGIVRAIGPVLRDAGVKVSDEQILSRYAQIEPKLQADEFRPYREILTELMLEFGRVYGVEISREQAAMLPESIKDWPAFGDTAQGLARLGEKYRLGILSNIDRDLIEMSLPRLAAAGAKFDIIVTAGDTSSYKPAIGHFWAAMRESKLPGARILHAAQSLFHDVVPAQSMGLRTAYINRQAGKPGATPPPGQDVEADMEFPTIRALAAALCGE